MRSLSALLWQLYSWSARLSGHTPPKANQAWSREYLGPESGTWSTLKSKGPEWTLRSTRRRAVVPSSAGLGSGVDGRVSARRSSG